MVLSNLSLNPHWGKEFNLGTVSYTKGINTWRSWLQQEESKASGLVESPIVETCC